MLPDPDRMTSAEFFDALFLLGAVPGVLFAFLPSVLAFLGLTRVWFTVQEDPTLAEPDGTDPRYCELFGELKSLGYRPVGMVAERSLFLGHEWLHTSWVRKFVSADGRAYASLYRSVGAGPWRLAFESSGDGGCLVQTACPGVGLTTIQPDMVRTEVGQFDVPEVEARHRRNLALVMEASGQRAADVSLEELTRRDERSTRSQVRRCGDPTVFAMSAIWFGIPAALMVGLHWVVAALLLPGVAIPLGIGAGLFLGGAVYAWAALIGHPTAVEHQDRLLFEMMAAFPPVDLEQLLPQAFPAPGEESHLAG